MSKVERIEFNNNNKSHIDWQFVLYVQSSGPGRWGVGRGYEFVSLGSHSTSPSCNHIGQISNEINISIH